MVKSESGVFGRFFYGQLNFLVVKSVKEAKIDETANIKYSFT